MPYACAKGTFFTQKRSSRAAYGKPEFA